MQEQQTILDLPIKKETMYRLAWVGKDVKM